MSEPIVQVKWVCEYCGHANEEVHDICDSCLMANMKKIKEAYPNIDFS
jgi:primosomal protein N'